MDRQAIFDRGFGFHPKYHSHILDELKSEINELFFGACYSDNLTAVKFLIDKGCTNFNMGIYWSIKGKADRTTNFLLEKGANDWDRIFEISCMCGNLNCVQLSLPMITNVNLDYSYAYACLFGHIEIVKYLDDRIKSHEEAIFYATRGCNYDIVHFIISKHKVNKNKSLIYAIRELLDYIKTNGLYVRCRNGISNVPWLDLIKLLLLKGASNRYVPDELIPHIINVGVHHSKFKSRSDVYIAKFNQTTDIIKVYFGDESSLIMDYVGY